MTKTQAVDARAGLRDTPAATVAAEHTGKAAAMRVGLVSNPRSHRNRAGGAAQATGPGGVTLLQATPRTHDDLARALAGFAAESIDLLIVDGGDGTLRDVLTTAIEAFGTRALPPVAIVPAGKTNALAIDLGIPPDWSVDRAIAAAAAGNRKMRSPVEVSRDDAVRPQHRGFLLGAGGFVRATELAQRTHKAGAFHGIAVGLSLGWSIMQTAFGRRDNAWRRGETMTLRTGDAAAERRALYLVLASTLEQLPLGLKPFGPVRAGMKLLVVDAPPRQVWLAAPIVVSGGRQAWLEKRGYHQLSEERFELDVDGDIILDGEHYRGGRLTVRRGAPLAFIVP